MELSIQSRGIIDVFGAKEGCKLIKECGFDGIDWSLDMDLYCHDIEKGQYRNSIFEKEIPEILDYYHDIIEELKKNELKILQAHAPFPIHLIDLGEEFFEYMIEIVKKCILLCEAVECKNLVVHGISLSETESRINFDDIDKLNDRLYMSLIPTLQQTNVTVCLENLFRTTKNTKNQIYLVGGHCSNPYEAVAMIDKLNKLAGKECFGLCLDVGHLQISKQDIRRYTTILGRRIKALHINDNDGVIDLHLAPYTGTVNWQNFYTALKAIGYDGALNFETFRQIQAPFCDKEMIKPWLQLIASSGKFFETKISNNFKMDRIEILIE